MVKPADTSDLRQDPVAEQQHPNVIPVHPQRHADHHEPEPAPTTPESITMTFRDLGGRRLLRPDAPAADRDGTVTLPFDGHRITVPDILIDTYRHGPPLGNNYVSDDDLRRVIATVTAVEPEGATR